MCVAPDPPEIGSSPEWHCLRSEATRPPISGFIGSWQGNLALNKGPGPVCQQCDDLTEERVKLQLDVKMTRKGSGDLEFLTAAKKRHGNAMKQEALL